MYSTSDHHLFLHDDLQAACVTPFAAAAGAGAVAAHTDGDICNKKNLARPLLVY